jgi:hypothetical protein
MRHLHGILAHRRKKRQGPVITEQMLAEQPLNLESLDSGFLIQLSRLKKRNRRKDIVVGHRPDYQVMVVVGPPKSPVVHNKVKPVSVRLIEAEYSEFLVSGFFIKRKDAYGGSPLGFSALVSFDGKLLRLPLIGRCIESGAKIKGREPIDDQGLYHCGCAAVKKLHLNVPFLSERRSG